MSEPSVRMPEQESAVSNRQYVTFLLNNERYAVEALHVQEIVELSGITRVPHLPDFLKGVINLRGTIIPVVDLKTKFGMASGEYQKHTCVIVTEFSGGVMGVIVDAVSDVLHLPETSVEAAPSFGPKIRTDFIAGLGKVADQLAIILNMEKVLSAEEAALLSVAQEAEVNGPLAA